MAALGMPVVVLLATWIAYVIYGAVYRLYLSPIAKFPGPRLAALTRLFELYYEVVKGGQYTFKIGELHEKYGPIIRINPWELHVNDPDYYDVLYTGASKKRDKYRYYCEQFGNSQSIIGTVSHNLHRLRRIPLSKFFSKASVTHLEPVIQSSIDKLIARLQEFKEDEKPVPISLALGCLTNDVVCEYAFAKSDNLVETSQEFHTDIHDAMVNVSEVGHFLKQVPWLISAMKKVPPTVIRILDRKIFSFIEFQNKMASQIKSIIDGDNDNHKWASHPTIFHAILESDLPAEEKKLDRLWQEGQTLVGAGTETTAWTMSVIVYHVLSNPAIFRQLREELEPIMKDSQALCSHLEALPYFTAVVSEGLRLAYGVTTHLQRVSPNGILTYKDWSIPAGTPVGMTSVLIHLNPSIFPQPNSFIPERWLENPRLAKYLVSFTKGSRQCIGMNLAYAEIYICLANLFHAFPGMRLYDTTKVDVEIQADNYMPKASGRGVKVMLG